MSVKPPHVGLRTRLVKTRQVIEEESTLWPRGIIRHTLEILVLLGGAAAVGWVIFFVEIPFVVYITLLLLELIMLLEVLNRLLPIVAKTVRETNHLTLDFLNTWSNIRSYRKRRQISIIITEGSIEKKIDIEVTTDMREIAEVQELFSLLGQAAKVRQASQQNDEEING